MTWLFSKALMKDYENSRCSQVQVAESSEVTCSAGEPYAQLNVMPTPHKFWRNDKTMEFSDLSRFGLTLRLLTESHGEAVLTWFLEGFPVKELALPAKALASKTSAAACGLSKPGSFAKFDLDSRTWKTAQHSLLGGLAEFSETWPRWGMQQNGVCYQVQTVGRFICENEFGFSLPTTGKNEGKGSSKKRFLGSRHFRGAKMSEGLRTCETDPIYLHPLFAELTMMWPLGWTDLQPLGMDKFLEWQQQHGGFLADETN